MSEDIVEVVKSTNSNRIYDVPTEIDGSVTNFRELYSVWNNHSSLLPFHIWNEINDSKPISKNDLFNFIDDKMHPHTQKIIVDRWKECYNLNDEKFYDLWRDTEKEFTTPTLQSVSQIITFIQYICIAYEKGAINEDGNILMQKLSMYIDMTTDIIYAQSPIDYNEYYRLSQEIRDKTTSDTTKMSLFISCKKILLNKLQHYYNNSEYNLFKMLLEQINEHSDSFEDWFYKSNIIKIDIYSFQEPKKLWAKIKDLPTKDFRSIQENLRTRIVNYIVDKEKQASEIEFWKKYMDIMKHDKDEWEKENKYIWKCDYVNVFIELVNKAFDEIEQPKEIRKI